MTSIRYVSMSMRLDAKRELTRVTESLKERHNANQADVLMAALKSLEDETPDKTADYILAVRRGKKEEDNENHNNKS